MAGVYALMVALIILAVWHSRAHRCVLARWGGLGLAAVVFGLSAWLWPWNMFALQPENQPAAETAMAAGFESPSPSLQLQEVQQANETRPSRSSQPLAQNPVAARQ